MWRCEEKRHKRFKPRGRKVPMRRLGADCSVVAMKRGNARGAKGAGHRHCIGSTGNGRNPMFNGRRQPSCDGTSRMTRECQVRLCVQLRLACSAGGRPAGARVRSPVVRIAGWRETKILKPIDAISLGGITSHRAVTTVNVHVASKMNGSEGRARNRRAKAAWGAEI